MTEPLQAVEAADSLCPSRTVWVKGDDGYWHCTCCTTRRRYDELVEPVPVSS